MPKFPKILIFEKKDVLLDLFEKILAWLICQKILAFREKDVILRSFWKSRSIFSKILTFRGKELCFSYLWKNCFFANMSKKIKISREITLFWDHFEKVVVCSFIRKYQHFEKKDVVFRSLYKSSLLLISLKILTFWGQVSYFDISL